MKTKRIEAVFIRHGQSAANVGLWSGVFSEIPLTEFGWEQARALAAQWDFVPGRIITSPFLRARQTAQPTIERFPDVPAETWPIHEFTYWDAANWSGSNPELKQEDVARFWRVADPAYRHGGRAESFGDLLERARQTLRRLQGLEVQAPVLLFTHGHFMQALRHDLDHPQWSDEQKMATFYEVDRRFSIKNTEQMTLVFEQGQWQLTGEMLAARERRV